MIKVASSVNTAPKKFGIAMYRPHQHSPLDKNFNNAVVMIIMDIFIHCYTCYHRF